VYYALVIVFLACRTLWDVHKMKKSIGAIGTANQLSKRDKQLRKVAFHVIIVAMAALFGLVVVAIGVANDQLWTNFIYSRWLTIFSSFDMSSHFVCFSPSICVQDKKTLPGES
jgi:ABC-type Fe3+ transport system permease subunit